MTYIFLTLFFIFMQAFFSGIETGLVSVMRPRIHQLVKRGSRGAKIIEFFLDRSELMLATTLLGTNICVVCASMLAKQSFIFFGFDGKAPMLTASICLTLLLLAAEIIPKNYFRQSPAERCVKFAGLLRFSYYFLCLPALALSCFTRWTVKLSGKKETDPRILQHEEFRLLLRESESAQIIDSQAAGLLDNALDFYSLKIKDLMTPRHAVAVIAKNNDLAQALKECHRSGFSRLVIQNKNNDWTGVFSIYEAMFGEGKNSLAQCIRQPARVKLNASCEEALNAARKAECPMLFVEDNRQKVVGIITVKDIVRKLF